jgi:predicted DNA-binding transcriptional regulator AlpA
MSDEFLSLEEAAKELGVSLPSMYQYMSAEGHPKFPNAVKPTGSKWAIPRSDIDALRGIKPVNPDKDNAIKDANLDIELLKKQNELEAIKLHFPTAEAYKKAQEKLVLDLDIIARDKAQNEIDKKKVVNAFATVKQHEDEVAKKLLEIGQHEAKQRDTLAQIEDDKRELAKLLIEYKASILPLVTLLRNGLKSIDAVIYYLRYYNRYKPMELFVNLSPLSKHIMRVADRLEIYINKLSIGKPE